MIYGFGDTDKSKVPINLKYEGHGNIKGVEPDDTETSLITIKKIISIDYTDSVGNGHYMTTQLSQNLGFVDPDKCIAIVYARSLSDVESDVVTIEGVHGIYPLEEDDEIIGYVVKGETYHSRSSNVEFSGYVIEYN